MGILGSQYSPDMNDNSERQFDWTLLWSMLAIVAMGLVNLYSAAADPLSASTGYFLKQVIFYGVGLLIILTLMFFDYRLFERLAYFIYGLNLLALAIVRIPGIGVLCCLVDCAEQPIPKH